MSRSSPPRRLTLRSLLLQAAVLVLVTAAVALLCSLVGVMHLRHSVWTLRLMRMAAAILVGAGLASSGTALQGLLRNPLAEPFILGISSGAGVGVLVGRVAFNMIGLGTPILAFIGAVVTCAVVYAIAQRGRRIDPYVLLLSGVIVNVFNGALIFVLLMVAAPNEKLNYLQWSMGEMPDWVWNRPGLLILCACFVAGGLLLLLLRGAALNTMGLGDDVAASSGVPVHWLRVEVFVVVGMMTAAAVCLAGPIGFVGLIIPHICRMLLGPDHRKLVLYSAAAGAIALMLADRLCQVGGKAIGVGEIPVGVVTALAGGPFFIYLLRRRFREVRR